MRAFKILILSIFLGAGIGVAGESVSLQFVEPPADHRLISRITNRAAYGSDSISTALSRAGYLNHVITERQDSLIVETGPQYFVGTIVLSVVLSDGDIKELIIDDYRNRAATQAMITWMREDIIEKYHSQGYYFAALHTDDVKLHDEAVDFHYRLITGPPVIIERLRFKGLTGTKPEYVSNLSGLRVGDILVRETVADAVRKIESEGYLQSDSTPQLTPNRDYDGVEILFHLTEQKSNRIELGGGYLPKQGDLTGEFVGRVDFESMNVFGYGRKLRLKFDRKDRASSRTEFRFVQPIFVPDHLELSAHFVQIDYDSSYYDFTAEGGVSFITRGGTKLSGSAQWKKTEPQRSSQPPSRTIAGRFEFESDRRDYRPNPSGGRMVRFGVSYLRRSSWPESSATTVIDDESILELTADTYFPFAELLVLRIGAELRARITPRELIDFSEQFKLGGYGSLRGYREDTFAGRRTGLGQIEIRIRPSRQFAAYLFGDIGYIYSKREAAADVIETVETVRGGSGMGIFVGNATVRMVMEIGWGYRDKIDDGKIHLGLSTLF